MGVFDDLVEETSIYQDGRNDERERHLVEQDQ